MQRDKLDHRMGLFVTVETLSIRDHLCSIFHKAISAAYPDIADPPVVVTTSSNPKFGDYQCNSAMSLAQQLSSSGNNWLPKNTLVFCLVKLEYIFNFTFIYYYYRHQNNST